MLSVMTVKITTFTIMLLLMPVTFHNAVALTIVRIGGQGLAATEKNLNDGIDFVQYTWEEAAAGNFGSTQLITFDKGSITPIFAAVDKNLTPSIRNNNGSVRILDSARRLQNEPQIDNLLDTDSSTVYEGSSGPKRSQGHSAYNAYPLYDSNCNCNIPYKILVFDLGALYNIDRIHFGTRSIRAFDRFIPEVTVGITLDNPTKPQGDISRAFAPFKSGGSPRKIGLQSGYLEFDVIFEDFENTKPELDLIIGRAIQSVVFVAPLDMWEIAEFEIYGSGYVPEAEFISDIIDLGGPSTVDAVTWHGKTQVGSHVSIRARSGADEDPNHYWRNTFKGNRRSRLDHNGTELTHSTYKRLEGGEAVGITPDKENWEFWTPPAELTSRKLDLLAPVPQQFAQFSINFSSLHNAGGVVDYLQFEVTQPPIVTRVVGEIIPVRTRIGEITNFTYKLLPTISEEDSGFDSIQINTPTAPTSVDAVRIGSQKLSPDEYAVGPFNGFHTIVRIPFVDIQSSGELIEIDFRTEIFQASTAFTGKVFDSTRPQEVKHRIEPGDADPIADGRNLTVTSRRSRLNTIQRLTASSITPNGDGINEVSYIEYDLINLAGQVPVEVDVYDLRGHHIASLTTDNGASGRFTVSWDGTEKRTGYQVPPGLYLTQVTVHTDSQLETEVTTIPVVY